MSPPSGYYNCQLLHRPSQKMLGGVAKEGVTRNMFLCISIDCLHKLPDSFKYSVETAQKKWWREEGNKALDRGWMYTTNLAQCSLMTKPLA